MAKGSKKKDKWNDNWQDELGEMLPPANEAETNEQTEETPDHDVEVQAVTTEIEKVDLKDVESNEIQSEPKRKSKKEKEKERKERQKAQKKPTAPVALDDKVLADLGLPIEDSPHKDSTEQAPSENKSGKVNPRLAALQAKIERQRALERQRKEEEEAERKRLEEIEKQEEEEKRKKEEALRKKKEKEKAKIEALKASGQYLTKKQRQQMAMQELRRKQIIESQGIVIEGLKDSDADNSQKKFRVSAKTFTKKPKKSSKPTKELHLQEADEHKIDLPQPKTEEPDETKVENDTKEEEADKSIIEEDDEMIASWEEEFDELMANEDKKASTPTKEAQSNNSTIDEKPVSIKIQKPNEISGKKPHPESSKAKKLQESEESTGKPEIRAPICCIMGHVDTGKTKLLDNIRNSNVQEGEAGGITQQIGATWFPIQSIEQRIRPVNANHELELLLPGVLIIDTPGHESFANLRSRGSSLCNLAILVIDITHGLEPQTLESIAMLKSKKTPFVVALNKVDRLYGWLPIQNSGFEDSLAKQNKACQRQFEDKLTQIKFALMEQGLNSEVFYKNTDFARYVSIVPTSAHSGEGIPDLLKLIVTLTQKRMARTLQYQSELECTILEVKVVEGLGTTIDCILSNGKLREGDRIAVCGLNGPIITNIRALLTPEPLVETRIKTPFVQHKEIKAAIGVKIAANDLDKAVAGSRILLYSPGDDEEALLAEVMKDLEDIMKSIKTTDHGVSVQASTLGSLEALLAFLNQMKVPVSTINIGPVYKRDIMRCSSMLEKAPELAMILCFDVKVDKDAEILADQLGIKIFSANIIYHLFDAFKKYQSEALERKRLSNKEQAVFPCVLKTIASFNKKDPIILGVDVEDGVLRVGTPICAIKQGQIIDLGRIVSAECNHKPVDKVRKGQAKGGVAISIESNDQILFGRQVDASDTLYSHITRETIDTLKDPAFRNEVTKDEWKLIISLKSKFGIV